MSVTVEPGEVVGLMGDNGAGKSMVKLIAGTFPPNDGKVLVDDHFAISRSPSRRGQGVKRHQDLALADTPRPRRAASGGRSRRFLAIPYPRQAGDDRPIGGAVCRARRKPPARSGPEDVGRSATGGGDRAHATVRRQACADGRTDGGHSVRQIAEVLELIRRL